LAHKNVLGLLCPTAGACYLRPVLILEHHMKEWYGSLIGYKIVGILILELFKHTLKLFPLTNPCTVHFMTHVKSVHLQREYTF
jgi:hypothetical protein